MHIFMYNLSYSIQYMLGFSSLFSLTSDPLKDTLLLYKRVTEQYRNPVILKIIRSLIPDNIVSQTIDYVNIVPLLKWFKDDFMRWTPKDPVCQRCRAADEAHNYNCGISNNNSSSSTCRSPAAAPMQAQTIRAGNSWKIRKVEIFRCNNCNYEYTFIAIEQRRLKTKKNTIDFPKVYSGI
jgi:hypothetical protein